MIIIFFPYFAERTNLPWNHLCATVRLHVHILAELKVKFSSSLVKLFLD